MDSIYAPGGLIDQNPNTNTDLYHRGSVNMAQGVIGPDGNPTYQSAGFIGANNYLQGVVGGQNLPGASTSQGAQDQYGQVIGQYGKAPSSTAYLDKTAQGDYNNPYLKAQFDQASRGVTSNYLNNVVPTTNSTAQAAGRYGSNALQTQQGANTAAYLQANNDLATQIYGGAYEAERGRQVGAQTTQAGLQQGINDTTLGAGITAAGQSQDNMQFNAGQIQQSGQFGTTQQMNAAGMAPAMDTAGYAGLDRIGMIGADQHDTQWQDVTQGAQIMGIAGGQQMTYDPNQTNKPSVIQGAIGGAATGASVGGLYGAAAGAVIGGAASYYG